MKRAAARSAASVLALAFLPVPRRHRFGVARRLALATAPAIRHLAPAAVLDGPREYALTQVLRVLRRHRIQFEIEVLVDGPEPPEGAVLFAGAHFLLAMLFNRWMHDRGTEVTAVSRTLPAGPMWHVGTAAPVQTLRADRNVLLKIRSRLAAGCPVSVMIDGGVPGARSVEVRTAAGTRYVSDAAIRLASRIGVRVFFVAVTLDDSGIPVIRFEPAPADPAAAVTAYAAFLRETAARIRR